MGWRTCIGTAALAVAAALLTPAPAPATITNVKSQANFDAQDGACVQPDSGATDCRNASATDAHTHSSHLGPQSGGITFSDSNTVQNASADDGNGNSGGGGANGSFSANATVGATDITLTANGSVSGSAHITKTDENVFAEGVAGGSVAVFFATDKPLHYECSGSGSSTHSGGAVASLTGTACGLSGSTSGTIAAGSDYEIVFSIGDGATIPLGAGSQSQNASASGNFTVHLTPVGSSGCPSGEVPSVKVGFALAEGCFKETHAGSKVFDTTKGAFVGGFLLTPKPGGKLRLRNDIAPARLEELGPGVDLVVHGAAHAFPAEAIPVGFAQADLNNNGTASGLQLVGDAVMKGFGFSSFPLKFGLKVKWATDGRSSTITGDLKIDDLWKAFGRTAPPLSAAGLPIGNASFGGVSGSVEWKATNGFGFDLSSVKVKGSKLGVLVGDPPQLLGISAYTLSITGFNSGVPTLEGSADISIPRSSSSGGQKPLVLGGRLKFVGSSFGGAGLKLDGLNKPIADTGVFFQGIVGDLDVRPAVGFRLGGLFTLLPPINGETIAEGTVELRGLSLAAGCTSGQKPIEIHTSITSGILEHHGIGELSADGSNCMYFGKFGVESVTSWDIGLDAGGFKKVMEAQGKLQGFIGTAGMNLEGGADLTLPFVPGTIGGNFLVSSTGFAACVRLTSFIQGGFGRAWTDPSPPQTFTACDLSPWRVSAGPRAAAVGTPHTVVVRSGLPVAGFLARGQAGPPRVKLLGPNGESFTAPADGHLVKTGAVVIATSKPERAVYFFVRKPAGGSWRIVDLDTSHRAISVASAHGLPDPRLKAHVSGKRSHRVLHYSLKARPGLKVQFEEAAGGILKPLGAPRSAAHGAIAFKPLVVRSKRHQIRALLSQDGIPQTDKVVAHFSLTPPGKPGKVKHLKATRTKTTLGVRFGAPRNAVRYLVVVSAGRAATFRTIITKTHLTVTGVPAKAKLSVSVTPENANDLRGPTARVKVR